MNIIDEIQFIYIFFLLFLVLLVSYLRRHCQISDHEDLLLWFPLNIWWFSSYTEVFDPFWVNFYAWYEVGVQIYSFVCRNPDALAPSIEKTILTVLNGLVKTQLVIDVWVYIWILNSNPLVSTYIHMPIPHGFISCGFVVSFEIRKWVLQVHPLSRLF